MVTTFSNTTLSKTTFSNMNGTQPTLNVICCYAEGNYGECHYAECHYAECRGAIKYRLLF
jgi:hypothetical protein